jgi:hypothetical protein
MTNLKNGFLAGFIATAVLSAMMVIKSMMGVMPQLDVAAMIGMMMGVPVAVGWIIHFMIGTIAWGGGFALLYDMIPGGSPIGKGIAFGVVAWLGMMVMIMPMAGAGFFGMNMGLMAPMMTLLLHIVFGTVLGFVYQSRATQALVH